MKVSVRMKAGALAALSHAQAVAASMTAQQMLNEIRNDQVMPFDTGNAQNDSTYVDDSQSRQGLVSIITDAPYARRLYFHPEYNFQTIHNPNARGEWWEEFLTGGKRARPKQLFQRFYRRVAGRYVR